MSFNCLLRTAAPGCSLILQPAVPLTTPCCRKQSDAEVSSGSESESDIEAELSFAKARAHKKAKQAESKPIDVQALQEHGYKSGPSILYVPAPMEAEQDWNW